MLDVDLLTRSLASRGYRRVETLRTGIVYDHPSCSTCLIVDLPPILTLQDFHYVDYTAHQNALAAKYDRLFRFLCLEGGDLETLLQELQMFCEGEQDREKVLSFGPNRTEQDIDPTPPEGLFEDGFLEAFGAVHRDALHFQFGYVDYEWKRRYLDFALVTRNGNFAIELNGETYHHPRAIGAARYRSQLFKQNSLFADGFKVFRWSLAGMADRTRFLDELRRFLGPSEAFLHKSLVKLGRAVETFSLLEHQEDALEYISELRREGRNAVLVVQPTGTGKTEIFLEDFRRLKELTPALRALVIVPSRALREQTLERFRERLPGIRCSDDFGHRTDYDVCVQTSAFMLRHYHECDREEFGYIVVDEAQHAPAAGLRTVLEYFNPANLLGVTATPDRLDQRKLEDLFGEYESVLSLKDAILRGLVDVAIIGADRITADGDTANKVGSVALALACEYAGIPFVVAAPYSTVDPHTATGADIHIEERDGAEVTSLAGVHTSPAGARGFNPAFDVTPHELISAIVTERGVTEPGSDSKVLFES